MDGKIRLLGAIVEESDYDCNFHRLAAIAEIRHLEDQEAGNKEIVHYFKSERFVRF